MGKSEAIQQSEDRGVQSIERALDIIEVLAEERAGLGVTELANRVELHKSTAHRLLSTLARRNYVEKNESGTYRIGLKLIEAVSCHINSLELQTEARPYIVDITSHLGLTSHLGILDGDEVVYIEKMDVVSTMKMYSQIGVRVHAYCSSLGKCLLSSYSKQELNFLLEDCSFRKLTPNTIACMEDFHEEMAKVRRQGWALDDEEFEIGYRCIGAPIYDYRGDVIAAISASGDIRILTDDRIESTAEYVKQVAKKLSRSMGYIE